LHYSIETSICEGCARCRSYEEQRDKSKGTVFIAERGAASVSNLVVWYRQPQNNGAEALSIEGGSTIG
ncbi:MAG: hypothetical protein DME76_09130, partial [Verrucomicrobia bacterium]